MNDEALRLIAKEIDKLKQAMVTVASVVTELNEAVINVAKAAVEKKSCCSNEVKIKAAAGTKTVSLKGKKVKGLNQRTVVINGRKFSVCKAYVGTTEVNLRAAILNDGIVVGIYKD